MVRKWLCWNCKKDFLWACAEKHGAKVICPHCGLPSTQNIARKEKRNKTTRLYNKEKRNKIFNHYGNKCACCGESHEEFLTIDHMANNGAKHRRIIGLGRASGIGLYHWLIKNNYPDGFQTLCMNCNHAKGKLGYCPHERENSPGSSEKPKDEPCLEGGR